TCGCRELRTQESATPGRSADLSDRPRGRAAHRRPVRHRARDQRTVCRGAPRCRKERSAPLMSELHAWLTEQLRKLSRNHDLAKAINYMLRRWHAFTRFLGDGRICITNNAAEGALRGIALGRKSWLFCGSDRGGHRAAVMYSLIGSDKLNDVDPQAWLADVLARIAGHPASRLDELLPWNWRGCRPAVAVAAQ